MTAEPSARRPFKALRNRNYRLYFYGQLVSLAGTSMQATVQSWLVFRITGSVLWLGVVTCCVQGTACVASPYAGLVVDRNDRRRLFLRVELLAMLHALTLAALVFGDAIRVWHIAALAVVLGGISAFETTIRHAFAYDLVGPDDLPSAISLNSVVTNTSRMFGSVAAGAALALGGSHGEAWGFLANGISFLAVLLCLHRIDPSRLHRGVARASKRGFVHEVTLGFHHVRATPEVGRLLAYSMLLSFLGSPFTVLYPLIATRLLYGGAGTLAALSGASGAGLLIGALHGARTRSPPAAVWGVLLPALAGLGIAYGVLAWSHDASLSMAAAATLGYCLMRAFPLVNTTLQLLVDHGVRGRVIAIYGMTFLGGVPLGALAKGWVADRAGVAAAALATGILCTAIAIAGLAVRARRRAGAPR